MRIGLDFDGVIADITSSKIASARALFGVTLTPAETARPRGVPRLGEERYRRLVEESHGAERTAAMPPIAGALEAVRRLARDHELHVVTARTAPEAQAAAAWLARHALPVAGIVHTASGSKAGFARRLALDAHLDDGPHVFEDLDVALAALLATPYNAGAPLPAHVRVVAGWEAFEALVSAG